MPLPAWLILFGGKHMFPGEDPIGLPTDPTDPPPLPAPRTFADLLKEVEDDEAVIAEDTQKIDAATAALSRANDALQAAQKKKQDDQVELAHDQRATADALQAGGPRYVGPFDDGSVDVYTANGDGGYHFINVKHASTPI